MPKNRSSRPGPAAWMGRALLILTITTTFYLHADTIPIGQAAHKGSVKIVAKAENRHKSMRIRITSKSKVRLTLDMFGARFDPVRTNAQRLGVPRIALKSAGTELILDPGLSIDYVMPSFCLDESKPSPQGGTTYSISRFQVARNIQEVFVAWNEHPELPQSAVQSAVWKGSVKVLEKCMPARVKVKAMLAKMAKDQTVFSNMRAYRLAKDGVLRMFYLEDGAEQTEVVGKNIGRIYECGGELVALRLNANGEFFTSYAGATHDGVDWHEIGKLPFAPARTVLDIEGKYLFFEGARLFQIGKEVVNLRQPLKQLVSGSCNGKWILQGLTERGRLAMFDPRSLRPLLTSQRYDELAFGKDLQVFRKGNYAMWRFPRRPAQFVRFGNPVERILANGSVGAAVCGKEVCVFDKSGMKRISLESTASSIGIDPSSRRIHVLTVSGKIESHRF